GFDPIFEPWIAMSGVPGDQFASRLAEWLAATHSQRNRRVAAVLTENAPPSRRDLAERLGRLFEQIDRQWLAALEAARTGGAQPPTALPDEADEALRAVLC